MTSIAVPISVATAILAPQIIQALYGSRWAAAAAPLRVLAVFGCFRAMWMLNGYLYNAIGRPQIDFYMNLGRLVVMVPLLFPLTLRYGVVGAATAVTLPMVLQFCVGVYLSRRYIGVPATTALGPLAIAIWQSIVLGVILLLARSVVSAGPRLNLVVFMGVSAVVWSAFNLRGMRAALSARRLS